VPFGAAYDGSLRAVDEGKVILRDVDLARGKGREKEKEGERCIMHGTTDLTSASTSAPSTSISTPPSLLLTPQSIESDVQEI
jgi:hypothetical protein